MGLVSLLWVILTVTFVCESADLSESIVYVPAYDDVCTNECKDSDPRYWCGTHKEDAAGRVMRCVQFTRYGEICVDECGGKERNYNWCLLNAVKIKNQNGGEGNWWDYCSLVGYTIKRQPCIDECGLHGENYFWCNTGEGSWDYCSPPGLVKPVQYTINGAECISECRQHGENYHWCRRSQEYCDEEHCDWDWDYCSLDQHHTRYNYKCKNPCDNKGTSYYWCDKEGGSWDYCSPSPRLGEHKSAHVELTRYGIKCRDVCSQKGENYYWCSQHGGERYGWWDYCSPNPQTTINLGQCTDECEQRGSSYFWCHTEKSWDYCSPKYDPEHFEGHEYLTYNYTRTALILGGFILFAPIICFIFFFVTRLCIRG